MRSNLLAHVRSYLVLDMKSIGVLPCLGIAEERHSLYFTLKRPPFRGLVIMLDSSQSLHLVSAVA